MVVDTPHVVCVPHPAQSHIGAMMKLAKLLHSRGFYITFVNMEHNHNCILRARGLHSLDGTQNFQFQTIPDGLPPSDANTNRDMTALGESLQKIGPAPFINLLEKLKQTTGVHPVTAIVSDGFMSFTVPPAKSLEIPVILLWTISACNFMGVLQFPALVQKILTPLEDNIPGMKDIRLKDLPGSVWTTDPNNFSLIYSMESARRSAKASANIIHTFDALEGNILDALSPMVPDLYAIGPLQLLLSQATSREQEQDQEGEIEGGSKSIGFNMWKEETGCIRWLDFKEHGSVIYVNFGSLAHITSQQLIEIGWGLANSRCQFLWILRPDLVTGDSAVLGPDFEEEAKERGLIASWCPQEQVLNHPSVGGFLTHCGWNSTIESLSAGVPMICWPFFGDQPTNCKFICSYWKAGLEMDGDHVTRDEVEKLVRELMGGEEGVKLKKKALEWKKLAEEATGAPNGSSHLAFDKLVDKLKLNSCG